MDLKFFNPYCTFNGFHTLDCIGAMTTSVAEVSSTSTSAWQPQAYIAKGELHLHTSLEQCEIRLSDISGRELLKMTATEKVSVPLCQYSQGIYILHLINPHTGEVRVQKLIKHD